jgi:simple sugar transport system permease protein
VFQGLLLFSLLACDTLIHYRIRWRAKVPLHARAITAAVSPVAAKEA